MPVQRLGVGSVLARSFPIWGKNVLVFSFLNLVVYAPLIAYAVFAFPIQDRHAAGAERTVAVGTYGVILGFGGCLLWFIAPLAMIHGVLQQLRGERATLGGCLRVYLLRLLPALGVGVIVGILAFLASVVGVAIGRAIAGQALVATIGLLLPATLVGCRYWVVVPVAAAERRGLVGSIVRSAALTRGSRLRIFVVVLVGILFQLVPFVVFRVLLLRLAGTAAAWTLRVLTIVLGAFGAVATGVAYHDLREAKDGVSVEDLVNVFA